MHRRFQCDTALNTFANFQLAESGNNVKLYDLEPAWGTDGPGGAGEPTQGIQTRLFALAGEWLIPDPVTGMPDRIIPRRLPVGGTTTEAPSFFELTGIPFAPEHVVVRRMFGTADRPLRSAAGAQRGRATAVASSAYS